MPIAGNDGALVSPVCIPDGQSRVRIQKQLTAFMLVAILSCIFFPNLLLPS